MFRKLLMLVLVSIIFFSIPVSAGPILPCEFYGNVSINETPAPAGTFIEALINNQVTGTLTTSQPGLYGGMGIFDPRVRVTGQENGQLITFFINGQLANQTATFQSGITQRLDLTLITANPGTQGSSANVTPVANATVSPTTTADPMAFVAPSSDSGEPALVGGFAEKEAEWTSSPVVVITPTPTTIVSTQPIITQTSNTSSITPDPDQEQPPALSNTSIAATTMPEMNTTGTQLPRTAATPGFVSVDIVTAIMILIGAGYIIRYK